MLNVIEKSKDLAIRSFDELQENQFRWRGGKQRGHHSTTNKTSLILNATRVIGMAIISSNAELVE